MSIKNKIKEELNSLFWTSLYFFSWFGALMVIKVLLLREYEIEFVGLSKVLIGTLIVSKVILILEYVPLSFTKKQPAIISVLVRTLLYLVGVMLVLILERSIEGYNEYGGFKNAFLTAFNETNIYHVWVNSICVFGALFFFNLSTLLKKYIGEKGFQNMLLSPAPDQSLTPTEKK